MFVPQMFRGRSWSGGSFWQAMLGGISSNQSKAGIITTSETAMALSAVRAYIALLAESVAQLPCKLYRRGANGGRERATDHPVYDLTHSQPNRKDTSFEYFKQQQGLLGLEGSCCSIIDRDERGYPRKLVPVSPRKVIVLEGPDGMPYYELPEVGKTLPMRIVRRVKVFSLDGYIGSSPVQTNADVLGLNLAVEEYTSRVFRHDITMSGVIERPKDAPTIRSQDAIGRLLAKWTDRYSGVGNAFSVTLPQEGTSYKQLSQDSEKAQLLQSRQWGMEEMCRLYKIPPHMVQILAKATNNNIGHQGLQFVVYTLLAWLKHHGGALMRDLLLPSERGDLYIGFNAPDLLRRDQKSCCESYALGRQRDWLSVDDIRHMENLPSVAGGDKHLAPLNVIGSEQILPGGNTPTAKRLAEINSILSRNWMSPVVRADLVSIVTENLVNLSHLVTMVSGVPHYVTRQTMDSVKAALVPRIRRLLEEAGIHMTRDPDNDQAPGLVQSAGGMIAIPVHGILVPRRGQITAMRSELISYERMRNQVHAALSGPSISEIVLDINSDSGVAVGCKELAGYIFQSR